MGRLDEEGEVEVDEELAWSAAHVTDEERESGQCTTPWLDSFGGNVEDVEVQLPMVLDSLGPRSSSGGKLGHGSSVVELLGKKRARGEGEISCGEREQVGARGACPQCWKKGSKSGHRASVSSGKKNVHWSESDYPVQVGIR